jgi:tRNA 2-selenouridine synthase SelU
VRHGIMMVGGTMCGKSTVVSCLQNGLTLVSEFKTRLSLKKISINAQSFKDEIKNLEIEIEEEKTRSEEDKKR